MKPTAEQERAQNRIHDVLTELADVIGPNFLLVHHRVGLLHEGLYGFGG